jgi:competence protein ComFC
MKVDLSKITTSYEWQYSLVGLSRDGVYIELRDQNHIQYVVNTYTGKIQKRNYYSDYLFLNHRIGERFYEFKEGNLFIPHENGEGQYSETFSKPIDDAYYVRGVIFSEIDFDANRLIIVSRCPNSLKGTNNDFSVEDFLYKNSSSFHWYRRPQENEKPENTIIIAIFDLEGSLIKHFFLQQCDASAFYMTCESSISRKELLLFSNEHTFRINYYTGNLVGLYEGESVNFITNELLGHWGWMGYDSFFGGELILNNSNDVVAEIDLLQFNVNESGNFWINKTVTEDDSIYFITNYPNEFNSPRRRIFKMKINNLKEHQSTDLILSDKERLLAVLNNILYTYSINDEFLLINKHELESLTFNYSKSSTGSSNDYSKPIKNLYYIDIHTKNSKLVGENKFQTERTQVGELLYKFKYCSDYKVLEQLHSHILSYLKKNKIMPDVIIPVPPSNLNRPFQPVYELAKKLAESGFNVDFDFLIKTKSTPPVKEINDPITRKDLLKNIFEVKDLRYKNKSILLFDDLFRSGETLFSIANVLKEKGFAKEISAFTITKTRTKK